MAKRRAKVGSVRPTRLAAALLLGLGSASHVAAQTLAHANGVALTAINAIAGMAAQSADKEHAAQVMQAAIAAVADIATTTVNAQASVETTRIVHGGEVVEWPGELPELPDRSVEGPVLWGAPSPPTPLPPAGEGSNTRLPPDTEAVVEKGRALSPLELAEDESRLLSPRPLAGEGAPAGAGEGVYQAEIVDVTEISESADPTETAPPFAPVDVTAALAEPEIVGVGADATEQREPLAAPQPLPAVKLPGELRETLSPDPTETDAAPRTARAPSGPVAFNASALAFPVDLSLFAEGNSVPPGNYRVDVAVNDHWLGKFDVRFDALQPDDRVAQPCFDATLLDQFGFDPKHLNPAYSAQLAVGEFSCGPLDTLVAGASYQHDYSNHSLTVTAPQIVMLRQARGYVDPSRWDAGVNAVMVNYDYSGWLSQQSGGAKTSSHSVGLRGGVNLGSWRFRYRATLSHGNDLGLQYRHDSAYLERALPKLASRLTLGETHSDGRVFDSLRLRGLTVATDERMQPDSRGGFAPVIRGVAQSNARVTIHQRGTKILETTVPPGPFELDDLYPNGSGGDLLVTITEADGTEHQFSQPYSSLPELLRPGVLRYSLAFGQYYDRALSRYPLLDAGTVSAGVNNMIQNEINKPKNLRYFGIGREELG